MTISVIIPTARGARMVGPLVESLRGQVFDGRFEIVVVNDRPAADLDHLSFSTDRCDCTVLRGEHRGPARARNLGAARAKGTYLLFLDDDVRIDTLYLARMLRAIEARPTHAISGAQIAIEQSNCFSLAAEWMLQRFIEEENSQFAPSNGLMLRSADFERCGGFDPYFPLPAGEDREFCVRWIAAGFHTVVLKEVAIEHYFPEGFASLVKQNWRYGRGALHFKNRVKRFRDVQPRIRGLRFYWRMMSDAPHRYGFGRGVAVGALCWICQGVLVCGYLRERIWPSPQASPEGAPVVERWAE